MAKDWLRDNAENITVRLNNGNAMLAEVLNFANFVPFKNKIGFG